jgi:hypothetical protein
MRDLTSPVIDADLKNIYEQCMALPMTAKEIVSFDPGFWGVKAFGPEEPLGVTFRSIYGTRVAKSGLTNLLFATPTNEIGLVDEVTSTDTLFGQAAANEAEPHSIVQRNVSADTSAMQLFLQAALSRVTKPGNSRVWLVVGLPVAQMDNLTFMQELGDELKGLHQFQTTDNGNQYNVLVEKMLIQPQPAGALFDMIIDDNGIPTAYMDVVRQHPSAIIATGGMTAEMYVIKPVEDDSGLARMHVDANRSRSKPAAGVRVMHDYLLDKVWNSLDNDQKPSPVDIDKILRNKKWWNGRQEVDLSPQIEAARQKMLANVLSLVNETIGLDNTDLRYIALAGGSIGHVQNELMSELGEHRVFSPGTRPGMTDEQQAEATANMRHPERVIARGLLKYGRFHLVRDQERQRGS